MTHANPQESDNSLGTISISGSSGVTFAQGNNNTQGNNNQVVIGDNNQVQQSQGAAAAPPLSKDDVLALLAELDTLIKESALPEEAKDDAVNYLKAATKATEKDKPKETVKTNLETMTETLSEASKTVEAGKTFWDTARPIMVKIGTWLGVATFSALL